MATEPVIPPPPVEKTARNAVEEHGSFRKILKGTALVGSVQVANALFSILRMKFAALMLGPAGVGIIGLWSSFQSLVESFSKMGLGTAGVREIVQSAPEQRARARLSLRIYAVMLAAVSLGIGVLFAEPASIYLTEGDIEPRIIGWLFAGASFGILSTACLVEMRGLHKIGNVAASQFTGAAIGTAVSIASLYWFPDQAILIYTVAPPFAVLLATLIYLAREPLPRSDAPAERSMRGYWRGFLETGVPVMLAGLSVTVAMYVIRFMVNDTSGAVALGYFVAAFMLSNKYLDFLFKAMGTDFYPRIAAVSDDAEAAAVVIDRQTRILLNLGTPILLGMIGLAPIVLTILYASEFSVAARLFQLFIAADFLKMLVWPIDFYLLARGRNLFFTIKQFAMAATFAGGVWLFFDGSLESIGWAYVASRIVNLVLVYGMTLRISAYRFSARSLITAGLFTVYCVLLWLFYDRFTLIVQIATVAIALAALLSSASDIRAVAFRKKAKPS